MKSQAPVWTHSSWGGAHTSVKSRQDLAEIVVITEPAGPAVQVSNSLAAPLRIVGILAFCQVAFFAVLFLFLCAQAGAATEGKQQFNGELRLSEYTPKQQRDPFGSGVVPSSGASGAEQAQPVVPVTLKLQGILYHAVHPSAMINDQLIELKKPMLLRTKQGDLEVQALEITREIVLLEVAGQKIELRLGTNTRERAVK